MDNWTAAHFSKSNPAGEGQDDIAALLRSVADSVEMRGDIRVMDVVFHNEITAEGNWPSMTVYYKRPEVEN